MGIPLGRERLPRPCKFIRTLQNCASKLATIIFQQICCMLEGTIDGHSGFLFLVCEISKLLALTCFYISLQYQCGLYVHLTFQQISLKKVGIGMFAFRSLMLGLKVRFLLSIFCWQVLCTCI